MYKIIRHYLHNRPKRTIETGLTLEQAQAHCNDPESSYATCQKSEGNRRTAKFGPWFDGYEKI